MSMCRWSTRLFVGMLGQRAPWSGAAEMRDEQLLAMPWPVLTCKRRFGAAMPMVMTPTISTTKPTTKTTMTMTMRGSDMTEETRLWFSSSAVSLASRRKPRGRGSAKASSSSGAAPGPNQRLSEEGARQMGLSGQSVQHQLKLQFEQHLKQAHPEGSFQEDEETPFSSAQQHHQEEQKREPEGEREEEGLPGFDELAELEKKLLAMRDQGVAGEDAVQMIRGEEDEGEMRVGNTMIPPKYRHLFTSTPTEEKGKAKGGARSAEERQAEMKLREQEALLRRIAQKRAAALGKRSWLRDDSDYPYTRRQKRVSAMLELALSDCIDIVLQDTAISNIWFGDVVVTPSMRTAKVYWNCPPKEQANIDKIQRHLVKKGPQVRFALTQKISLKYSPELIFVYDDGQKQSHRAQTEKFLEKIEQSLARSSSSSSSSSSTSST